MAKSADFTDILLRQKVISTEQLEEARKMARDSSTRVGDALVRLGYATGVEVMRAMAEYHRMDFVDLEEVVIPPDVIELVPESVARENTILPMSKEDGTLRVIVSDPQDLDTFEKLRFILDSKIDIVLAPRENILEAINRHYGALEGESADSMLQEFTDTAIDFTETEMAGARPEEVVDESSAPIVRLTHLIISEAVQLRASDIHVEPFENEVRIRYRIDGVLVKRDSPPRRLLGALLSRLKIMAKMDIAERRRTQDGRIKVTVGDKELDLRVSMLPTNHGQSCVMRLLDKDNIKVGVRQLGLSEKCFQNFQALIKRPNGIFLVTGPTGSGKTTTLYAALNELNGPDRKIITAEDPVEYYLPGINQVEVKHDIGLDFARIIRAVLRQAPNIILVGEMRDTETAEMGIQASLTGHLVFSTLHTNDAPSAVTRLIDMGVPPYLVASSLMAVLAQRLVRVICTKCRQPYSPSKTMLEAAGITPAMAANATFMKGKGCGNCQKTGFRGRLGVFELMMMQPKLREMAFNSAPSQNIRKEAIAGGMDTMYSDGIRKVINGVTTLEEVFRVAKRE
ncbi:MAG: GspE/PulE family protein [Planctomycetia bacterium]|nr:GspE/PulE family protein [Planctomycetia bacterium]